MKETAFRTAEKVPMHGVGEAGLKRMLHALDIPKRLYHPQQQKGSVCETEWNQREGKTWPHHQ